MTLNIEVDYETLLAQANQGAIYLFTGATSVEDMAKVHMDRIGSELQAVLEGKPLVKYVIDGRMVQDTPQPVEEAPETEPESQSESESEPEPEAEAVNPLELEEEMTELILPEIGTITDLQKSSIGKLDEAIHHVSMELGIPQKIKVKGELMESIKDSYNYSPIEVESVTVYNGFPIETEGMEEEFIITYKPYIVSKVEPSIKSYSSNNI